MADALYLDTSAALRAVIEGATDHQARIDRAPLLVTSRLTLVEAGRALVRLRVTQEASEERLADVARELDDLWARCHIWELSARVCEMALQVAPAKALRTLVAIHLATYVLARRDIEGLELLSADQRLNDAAGVR